MTATLAQTPLYDWHSSHGGRMVDFAGWSMPVQYTSIVAEHQTTRTAASLFDVSHMGRITFEGRDAPSFLDALLTRRVLGMPAGAIRYSLVTNDQGGILDDVLIYHLRERRTERTFYQLVVNASNRQKILAWLEAHSQGPVDLEYRDRTLETAMIAVQGPRAAELLGPLAAIDPTSMKYYTGLETEVFHAPAIVSRTGYTGEDGWEVVVPADTAVGVWQALLEAGRRAGAAPAGLGCRDTLRLEAGMPLYGHELSEQINPFEAGLDFAVDLENHSFPGRDILTQRRNDPEQAKRVGLELDGRRVPREGYPVFAKEGSEPIGQVTSGTFSPTLDKPIAMGYIRPAFASVGTEVLIDIRGRREPARTVKLPFYRRRPSS